MIDRGNASRLLARMLNQLNASEIRGVATLAVLLASILAMLSMVGCGEPTTQNWEEVVLLHDGTTVVVQRTQTFGGRHEIGQQSPIKEQSLSFSTPNSTDRIVWKSEYSEAIGRSDLNALALHMVDGVPYIVTEPNLCLAYNKWDRPNPPYVVFKYEGRQWRRIPLIELPRALSTINLVVDTKSNQKEIAAQSPVPAPLVAKLNGNLDRSKYSAIQREALDIRKIDCPELVADGKGGWISIDWFASSPGYESCVKVCGTHGLDIDNCPCERLFKRK